MFFIKWRLSSVALAVWTVSYSNFTAWPLLIRWCFVSSWPAVSLLLSSVRLSVRLSVRNPAGLRRSERGRTTATVQSNWLGKSSSRTSPACCPSTSLWERATCERNSISEDVWHSSHLCVCTNISVSEILCYCFLSCSVWTWTTSRKRVRRTQQQRSQSDGETWRRWRFDLFFHRLTRNFLTAAATTFTQTQRQVTWRWRWSNCL